MGSSLYSPPMGPGTGTPMLTPEQVTSKFFEFFPVGSHNEVLLLGDLEDYYVHRVKDEKHNRLCGARFGHCQMCERVSEGDTTISPMRREYYVPSFVRSWREKENCQKVSVFSEAAGRDIGKLFPEGSGRGQRIEVVRYAHGKSHRFKIKAMPGLPAGFPAVLPAAFDVVPFIRARNHKPADPSRPMVILPSFRCEPVVSGPAGRAKSLTLTFDDVESITPEEAAKLALRYAERGMKNLAERYTRIAEQGGVAVPAPAEPVEEKKLGELAVTELAADPKNYGPKIRLGGTGIASTLASSGKVNKTPGQDLVAAVKQDLAAAFAPPATSSNNGKYTAKNGGAK